MKADEQELVPPAELSEQMTHFLQDYYLIDVWRDRASYYALTAEDMKAYPVCICGLYVVFIMAGELEKAGGLLQMFDENHFFRMGLELVFPMVTIRRFIEVIEFLKAQKQPMPRIQITAGRPSLINGVLDYTRFCPFLERKKKLVIEDLKFIYDAPIVDAVYMLALAEWYYQQNRVKEADALVTDVIEEFNNDQQRRLIFVALYLKAKIQFASCSVSDPLRYIANIRRFTKVTGAQEFSYNIDAAEAYTALYEGNYELAFRWLSSDAPDEFADFCMLDLYRYMVKMRCYIVNRRYMSVVAIAERLRPLLEAGNKQMDLCEMDLLLAICYYRSDEEKLAFLTLERVLKTARRRGYYRLIADEGAALLPLLIAYIKAEGNTPFLEQLAGSVRNMAANYPLYLKPVNKGGAVFSNMEVSILKFLEQGKSKEELAKYFFISENTVKFHLKSIYKKLDAGSAHQAVWEARLLGVI